MKDLRARLSGRLHNKDIQELILQAQGEEKREQKEQLYCLTSDKEERVAYNALWVWTHFAESDILWLRPRQQELVDRAMAETHCGKKRLLLTILERLPFEEEDLRTDFIDFCLHGLLSVGEATSCKALYIKLAYKQCRYYQELRDELVASLDMLSVGSLSSGTKTARKNILNKLTQK